MSNLLFKPNELISEIESLRQLCSGFLDPSSYQIKEFASDIKGLVSEKKGSLALEIPKDRPLLTKPSKGKFEPASRKSGRCVVAKVSGIWDIEIVSERLRNPERPGKKASRQMLIGFADRASTEICIVDEGDEEPIALWKMEMGASDSPGCFFHTFASGDPSFPVPRHPNLFTTPMATIDFLLGELFQDEWESEVSRATDSSQRWRSIQSSRLEKLLCWQMNLARTSTSSPWISIKRAKPDPGMFIWPCS